LSQPLYAGLPSGVSLDLIVTVPANNNNKRRPIAIRNAGDGSGRLFIVLQNGEILIYDTTTSTLLPTPFLDISAKVDDSGNEQGLLGLAFHPDFAGNGRFYVNYTRDPGPGLDRTVIARYTVPSASPNQADENSEQVLLEVEQDFENHNGGNILFGPDGYLYIGMGDGGSSNDPNRHAQDITSLLGKMLRIDVDGTPPPPPVRLCGLNPAGYGIPLSNPLLPLFEDGFEDQPTASAQPACAEIWDIGLRNPWRWSFDRDTGDLFIGDVGQGAVEEIDFEAAGSGGNNYGWRCLEGGQVLQAAQNDSDPACPDPLQQGFDNPILTYTHAVGFSVTGGYRYRGSGTSLQGTYIYADLGGLLFFAEQNGSGWSNTDSFNTGLSITSFGEDENGEIYLTDIAGGVRFLNIH
jgi:hypothetical protein